MRCKSRTLLGALIIAGALGVVLPAWASDAAALQSEANRTDSLSARYGTQQVQTRMVSEFSAFAGSEANAESLVTGLRSGTPITLTSPSSGGTVTTLTFDPPTRPMGHGNIFISLALARQQLAGYGITDPTPQEIQAALTGGTITTGSGAAATTITLKGILTQRAEGMGWGAIANANGMNLGQVVSGLKSANQQLATDASAGSGATMSTGAAAERVQTGAEISGAARGNAGASARGSNAGAGIVTAEGARLGAGVSVQAGARASGAGIVTGAGVPVNAQAGARAQGQGRGLLNR
jgi:hypothetical protein